MLKEHMGVSQHRDEGKRRWFRDDNFDLIVWYEDQKIVGFQLCYDVGGNERAITWYATGSYSHARVDSGERPMGRKSSPVLEGGGFFDKERVLREFDEAAQKIDPEISRLVHDRLADYSG